MEIIQIFRAYVNLNLNLFYLHTNAHVCWSKQLPTECEYGIYAYGIWACRRRPYIPLNGLNIHQLKR